MKNMQSVKQDTAAVSVSFLQEICCNHEPSKTVVFVWQVLSVIYATHSGITESELVDLVPEITQTFCSLLCYVLQQYYILTLVAGLLVFDNDQVNAI